MMVKRAVAVIVAMLARASFEQLRKAITQRAVAVTVAILATASFEQLRKAITQPLPMNHATTAIVAHGHHRITGHHTLADPGSCGSVSKDPLVWAVVAMPAFCQCAREHCRAERHKDGATCQVQLKVAGQAICWCCQQQAQCSNIVIVFCYVSSHVVRWCYVWFVCLPPPCSLGAWAGHLAVSGGAQFHGHVLLVTMHWCPCP